VVLAALGQREQQGQPTEDEKRQARKQAAGVWIRSILVALVTTAIVWWLIARL
jgi:hypothetical protein